MSSLSLSWLYVGAAAGRVGVATGRCEETVVVHDILDSLSGDDRCADVGRPSQRGRDRSSRAYGAGFERSALRRRALPAFCLGHGRDARADSARREQKACRSVGRCSQMHRAGLYCLCVPTVRLSPKLPGTPGVPEFPDSENVSLNAHTKRCICDFIAGHQKYAVCSRWKRSFKLGIYKASYYMTFSRAKDVAFLFAFL